MSLSELIQSIESLRPEATAEQVVRWALMIVVTDESTNKENLPALLTRIEQTYCLVADQLSAVAEEIDSLARNHPSEFNPDLIWTLIKAIRVQKQALDLYEPIPYESVTIAS